MYFDELAHAIDEFSRKPVAPDSEALREEAEGILGPLYEACMDVRASANDYPIKPIRGDVWFQGTELAMIAEILATALKQKEWYDLEEHAHSIRCAATLAVQSHYHNFVGPAMIARADCNERLEKNEFALQLYRAVVADFSWIAEEWIDAAGPPSEEDRCSLECLATAIDRVVALQPHPPDELKLQAVLAMARKVLERK